MEKAVIKTAGEGCRGAIELRRPAGKVTSEQRESKSGLQCRPWGENLPGLAKELLFRQQWGRGGEAVTETRSSQEPLLRVTGVSPAWFH